MEEKLPTKTKIAAWLLRIISVIGIIGSVVSPFLPILFLLFTHPAGGAFPFIAFVIFSILGIFLLIISLSIFFIAELLFKKKRKGWWMAISIICLACIVPAIIGFKEGWSDEEMEAFVIILLMSLPPLILLLLDRKNFWKVAK